ncbi:MAG: HAD-IIIA family hydrolase [Ferruginibacter sp.]|nr:HAD-IIIA family hydrolase [Bacteroidota bacterium]MCW5917679.1 HAD-IIIA family hydrolase [Ferruginibacter sp.]
MNVLNQFKKISVFVFDMDGVLTDGGLLILEDGQMARRMHIKDGYALQLAAKAGYHILVISGGNSPAVKLRLEKLGIHNVYMGISNKLEVLSCFLNSMNLSPDVVLYMGDDIPDLDVMAACGLACCPSDAAPEIRSISHFISSIPGGQGCVREVIEKVMRLQGKWIHDIAVQSK